MVRCRYQERLETVVLWGGVAIGVISGMVVASENSAGGFKWTHFTIGAPLPGSAWGTGGTPLADFDGDGDLDIVLSRRETQTAYWFERKTDAQWVRHIVGNSEGLANCLGATELDINRDGLMDVVLSQVWFENPGNLAKSPDTPWPAHAFAGRGHDIIAADINGDGHPDIVTYGGQTISWFDTSAEMKQTDIGAGQENHGGTAPRGADDLDADGDVDVVIPGYWFANPGKGYGNWVRHEWPHLAVKNASYGTSSRTWIIDIDADGHNDIIYSDCDTGLSHVYIVRNLGKGMKWKREQLQDPPTEPGDVPGTGSFHSLGVADFDGDGDPDIFAGEQEDPDTYMESQGKIAMKPRGLKERGVIWRNQDGEFVPVVIHRDNPGWHDAVLGDVDGDGDIDIVTKIWNKDGQTYHADFWRNDTARH